MFGCHYSSLSVFSCINFFLSWGEKMNAYKILRSFFTKCSGKEWKKKQHVQIVTCVFSVITMMILVSFFFLSFFLQFNLHGRRTLTVTGHPKDNRNSLKEENCNSSIRITLKIPIRNKDYGLNQFYANSSSL